VKFGAAGRFGLDAREIAVMSASHTGEPFHVEAVRSILRKIGLPESALQCGAHAPSNAAAAAALERGSEPPGAVHNNCSGKHAGILALCLAIGADPATYMELQNPAQQEILKFCARLTGEDAADFPLGVDGCGIPVFATSLRKTALAFSRFATLMGLDSADAQAMQVVRDAMTAYPLYVSGTGEFDATLMAAAGGALACKAGAEGVHGDALVTTGHGLALKVLDGTKRAVAPAVLAILERLRLLPDPTLVALADFKQPLLKNRAGRTVGEIRARRVPVAARIGTP
jgi:L-asparaginase II